MFPWPSHDELILSSPEVTLLSFILTLFIKLFLLSKKNSVSSEFSFKKYFVKSVYLKIVLKLRSTLQKKASDIELLNQIVKNL